MEVNRTPFAFELSGRAVHVWIVHTEASEAEVARFGLLLSRAEKDRAAGFRFDHLRHGFTLARGCLRILLGSYLRVPPAAIQLKYGIKGKPRLLGRDDLQFN